MGYFKFPSFCICVVSKFSAVNMYYFYNKDRIITRDLAKGCSDSLTRGGPGGRGRALLCCSRRVLTLGSLGTYTGSVPSPAILGWAELGLIFSCVEMPPHPRDPSLAGGFITTLPGPLVLSSAHASQWACWGRVWACPGRG